MSRFPRPAPWQSGRFALFLDGNVCGAEPLRVLDGAWVVRRNGRLVPLDMIEPAPVALEMLEGAIVAAGRRWSHRKAFLRDHDATMAEPEVGRRELEAVIQGGQHV